MTALDARWFLLRLASWRARAAAGEVLPSRIDPGEVAEAARETVGGWWL